MKESQAHLIKLLMKVLIWLNIVDESKVMKLSINSSEHSSCLTLKQ